MRKMDRQAKHKCALASLRILVTYAGYLLLIFLSEVPHRHSSYSHLAELPTITWQKAWEAFRQTANAEPFCQTLHQLSKPHRQHSVKNE